MTLNLLALPHFLTRIPAMLMASIGFWLAVSPWFLPAPYPPAGIWANFATGLLFMGFGAMKFASSLKTRYDWLGIAFGVWLLFSPWIAGFSWAPTALRNTVLAASMVILMASWGLVGSEAG